MKLLIVDERVCVWKRSYYQYDETKHTQEEIVNAILDTNGESYKLDVSIDDPLVVTEDVEYILETEEPCHDSKTVTEVYNSDLKLLGSK